MCVCVQYNKLIIYVAISQQSITLIILQILPLLNINKLTVLKVFQTLSTFHPLGVTEAVYRQTSFRTLQLSVCVCPSFWLLPASCLLFIAYNHCYWEHIVKSLRWQLTRRRREVLLCYNSYLNRKILFGRMLKRMSVQCAVCARSWRVHCTTLSRRRNKIFFNTPI